MPSQPVWFHRLDEIRACLRGLDTGYLARAARGWTSLSVPWRGDH